MAPVLFGSFLQYLLGISLFLVALMLILLVLVQRGRGGGLTGALGGVGGQSAFGTKAGDLFTRITIGAAVIWLLLCLLTIALLNNKSGFKARPRSGGRPSATTPATGGGLGGVGDTTPGGATDAPASGGLGGATPPSEPAGSTPAGSTPAGSTPAGNTPAGGAPAGDAPAGDVPSGDAPASSGEGAATPPAGDAKGQE